MPVPAQVSWPPVKPDPPVRSGTHREVGTDHNLVCLFVAYSSPSRSPKLTPLVSLVHGRAGHDALALPNADRHPPSTTTGPSTPLTRRTVDPTLVSRAGSGSTGGSTGKGLRFRLNAPMRGLHDRRSFPHDRTLVTEQTQSPSSPPS